MKKSWEEQTKMKFGKKSNINEMMWKKGKWNLRIICALNSRLQKLFKNTVQPKCNGETVLCMFIINTGTPGTISNIHTHTHTHTHTYIYIYIYTYIHTHTRMYIYIYMTNRVHRISANNPGIFSTRKCFSKQFNTGT